MIWKFQLKKITWSFTYSLFQVIQGQLLHPYQTMRQLVREKVFIGMTFSPIFLWAIFLVVWRILDVLLFWMIPYQGFWIFLALWFAVGIVLYQILLLYLLIRFLHAA